MGNRHVETPGAPSVARAWRQVPALLPRSTSAEAWRAPLAVAVATVGPFLRAHSTGDRPGALAVLLLCGVGSIAMAACPGRWYVRLAIAITTGLLVALPLGGTLGVWSAAGLVLADWGIRGRAPLPGLPPGDASAVPGVLVLTALAAWRGRGADPHLHLAALLAGSVVVILIGSLFTERLRAAVRWIERWAGSTVSAAGFGLLFVPVVVVPWLVQRLAAIDPLDAPTEPNSSWVARRNTDALPDEPWRRDPTRRPVRGVGRSARGAAASLAVTALLLGGGAVAARELRGGTGPDAHSNTDPNETPAAFRDAEWYDEYQEDVTWLWNTSIAWDPLAPVRLRDVRTRHVNIVDGARTTWSPPGCECPRATVWMYGGSTTFGLGQRDGHTTASELARVAWEDGIALDIHNRGVVGDTHWEEAQRFAWDIATLDPPDLVVFLDGINDNQSIDRLESDTRQPMNFVKADFWENYLATVEGVPMDGRWAPNSRAPDDAAPEGASVTEVPPEQVLELDTPEDIGALIAKRYEWGRKMSRDIAEANGVPVIWYWQPSIPHRPAIAGEPPPEGREHALEIDRATLERLGSDVVDLTHAYDGHEEPLFWDNYHTNELGARLVAEAAYPALRPVLAPDGRGRGR